MQIYVYVGSNREVISDNLSNTVLSERDCI